MAIQFDAVRVPTSESLEQQKVENLILWGRILNTLSMAPYVKGKGSAGNMGCRIENGICVTPSGTYIGELKPDDLMVVVDVVERKTRPTLYFYGHPDKMPTSESLIYWDLFKKRNDANVILHGHDLLTLQTAQYIVENSQGHVAITENVTEDGSLQFRKEMKAIASSKANYLLGKEHGFFALGQNFAEAGMLTLKYHHEAINLVVGNDFFEEGKKKYGLL